jgi:hypothetical protein
MEFRVSGGSQSEREELRDGVTGNDLTAEEVYSTAPLVS